MYIHTHIYIEIRFCRSTGARLYFYSPAFIFLSHTHSVRRLFSFSYSHVFVFLSLTHSVRGLFSFSYSHVFMCLSLTHSARALFSSPYSHIFIFLSQFSYVYFPLPILQLLFCSFSHIFFLSLTHVSLSLFLCLYLPLPHTGDYFPFPIPMSLFSSPAHTV